MKQKYSKKRRFGNKGEDVALMFLMKQGFNLIARNYLKKVGEIDLIAEKEGIIHFVEVKSVSRETVFDVNYETDDDYVPEEMVNLEKMLHMKRAIELFIVENDLHDRDIQVDVITVTFYRSGEIPRINFIEDVKI